MPDRPHTLSNPFRSAPNLLTLLRICMVPILVSFILDGRYDASFLLFLIAGFTDALDGTLARLLNQRTVLGEYLDPVADKLLLSTLFLVLTHEKLIAPSVTVLVFGRDVCILLVSAILYAAVGRKEFHPSLLGKANTVVQVATVTLVLLNQVSWVAVQKLVWLSDAHKIAIWATVFFTVLSGLHYAWSVLLRGNGNGNTTPVPSSQG